MVVWYANLCHPDLERYWSPAIPMKSVVLFISKDQTLITLHQVST